MRSPHQISFSASCTWRGFTLVPLITPREESPNKALGAENWGVFMALNASIRNCALILSSLNRKFLNSDRSKFRVPGLRTSGSVRATFPNVNGGANENTEVWNHWFRRWSFEPPVSLPDVP